MRAWNITVDIEDRPGALGELGLRIGHENVNLLGVVAYRGKNVANVDLLVEKLETLRPHLDRWNIHVASETEVVVMELPDRPGALGEFCQAAEHAGINLDLVYVATGTRLVGHTDGDLAALESVWQGVVAGAR